MRPLTVDDLLPLEEYAARRREFFESCQRYLDRYRRIRIGPSLTLLFENRQTLWFRLHEILRVARLSEPERVREQLAIYSRLLPGRNQLHAALLIDVMDETRLPQELAPWQTFEGEELLLHAGDRACPARLVTCRPEDRCIGAAHWVRFTLSGAARRHLADLRVPAWFEVQRADYQHASPTLSDEARQSLLDDLVLSDRDEE